MPSKFRTPSASQLDRKFGRIVGHMTFADIEAVKRVVTHAHETNSPVMIVKDDGIYIMSGGHDIVDPVSGRRFVAYADGFDPRTEEYEMNDGWGAAADLMGGDDCVERIVLSKPVVDAIVAGRPMTIEVRERCLSVLIGAGK